MTVVEFGLSGWATSDAADLAERESEAVGLQDAYVGSATRLFQCWTPTEEQQKRDLGSST